MSEKDIEAAVLGGDPFTLKRISLSDGREFEVRAGKIAIATRVCSIVENGIIHTISNRHITRIAPVVESAL